MAAPGLSAQLSVGLQRDASSADRVWRLGAQLAAGSFRCPPSHPRFAGIDSLHCAYVVFPRNVVALECSRGGRVVANPNHAFVHLPGDGYRRAAIDPQGDDADYLALDVSLLHATLADLLPANSVDAGLDAVFRTPDTPIPRPLFAAQRRFFQRIAARHAEVDALLLEEEACVLLHATLQCSIEHAATRSDHRNRPWSAASRLAVSRAREILALDYATSITVAQLAHRVGVSAGHLARAFASLVGQPLHAYVAELRLRRALGMLDQGQRDISSLAHDLGYAHHSHFTLCFRRAFSATPSEYLRTGRRSYR